MVLFDDKNFFDLYASGKNDYEVAKILHVGRDRLRKWRNEKGVPSKTNKKNLSASLCSQILKQLEMGQTLTTIAKEFNVKRTSITNLLKRNGHKYRVNYRVRPKWATDYLLNPEQISVLIGDQPVGSCKGTDYPINFAEKHYLKAPGEIQGLFLFGIEYIIMYEIR